MEEIKEKELNNFRTSWNKKIAGIFIALLLAISGCSSNSIHTTSPTKADESKQVQTPTVSVPAVAQAPTPAPIVAPTPAAVQAPSPAPTVSQSSAPTPAPAITTAPAPTPVAPPVVTPTPALKQTPQAVTVYVTKTGKKYHRDGCRYLSQSRIPMSLSDAKSRYDPCSVCNPPQ